MALAGSLKITGSADVSDITKSLTSVQNAVQKLSRVMGTSGINISGSASGAGTAMGRLSSSMAGLSSGSRIVQTSIARMAIAFGNAQIAVNVLGRAVSTTLGLFRSVASGLIQFGISAIKSFASLEQNQVAFKVLIGNADKAQTVLQDLTKFADVTPFEPDEIIGAGRQLLAFGITADNLIPTLTSIGNLAAGTGTNIGELADALGKAKSRGMATNEVLELFESKGINIRKALGKILKVDPSKIFDMASNRAISFEDLEKAIASFSAQGGQFHGLMDEQSKTLLGRWSTITGYVKTMMADIGGAIAGMFDLNAVTATAGRLITAISTQLKKVFAALAEKKIFQITDTFDEKALGILRSVVLWISTMIDKTISGISILASFMSGTGIILSAVANVLSIILKATAAAMPGAIAMLDLLIKKARQITATIMPAIAALTSTIGTFIGSTIESLKKAFTPILDKLIVAIFDIANLLPEWLRPLGMGKAELKGIANSLQGLQLAMTLDDSEKDIAAITSKAASGMLDAGIAADKLFQGAIASIPELSRQGTDLAGTMSDAANGASTVANAFGNGAADAATLSESMKQFADKGGSRKSAVESFFNGVETNLGVDAKPPDDKLAKENNQQNQKVIDALKDIDKTMHRQLYPTANIGGF